VDKAFMATNGLSIEKGFTTPSIDLANVKKAMISTASTVIFLIDSRKLERVTFTCFAGLHDAHTIITDSDAPDSFIKRLQAEQQELDIRIV
jgi:DeoR/GlpR family transcriptional regulator of sugar metabolism